MFVFCYFTLQQIHVDSLIFHFIIYRYTFSTNLKWQISDCHIFPNFNVSEIWYKSKYDESSNAIKGFFDKLYFTKKKIILNFSIWMCNSYTKNFNLLKVFSVSYPPPYHKKSVLSPVKLKNNKTAMFSLETHRVASFPPLKKFKGEGGIGRREEGILRTPLVGGFYPIHGFIVAHPLTPFYFRKPSL